MRGILTGLVAAALLGSSGPAAAATEWVVLRVERVEVAVARADGSPWDDADPNGSQAAPDLGVRLAIDNVTSYVSTVARDRLIHDFAYDFLVPLDAVPPAGLTVEVFDQDGIEARQGEPLGTIRVTPSDIGHLLARPSRVKTYSDDSVTRLDISARRYRKSSRKRSATVRPDELGVLAPLVVAGEFIEVRASSETAVPTIIVGAAQVRLAVGRCTRALITSSGSVTTTVDASSTRSVRFELRVLQPSLAMWTRGSGWVPCDGRRVELRSLAAVLQVQALSGSTLLPVAIRKIVQARYLAGVQRCHERLLASDPMATGRLRVRYTVGPTGGVVNASAKGLARTLETCVESLMVKWRFGAPKDAQGRPTAEDVEAEIALDAR